MRRFSYRSRCRGAFTLVEVLMALLLMAIVLPVVMKGVVLATSAATAARRRTEAVGLAQSKLAEIIATGEWQQSSLSGDFSPDRPDYRWSTTAQTWAQDTSGTGMMEVDVTVTWPSRGREDSLTLASATYNRARTQP